MDAANVKKIAMDMLATKVLHFGPTYSRTERLICIITVKYHSQLIIINLCYLFPVGRHSRRYEEFLV
jgi:hypothetical protein